VLDLYKKGSELLYRFKTAAAGAPDQIKDADDEEKVVFDIIQEAGNMGIWIKDIRVRSNLTMTQLNKIVKSLQHKKLIKAVKSVAAAKKKVYMLFDLDPHRSLTGGAWYSDQDFESEFVTILNQQCHKYLLEKREKANAHPVEFGLTARRAESLTTLEELWEYINNLGISKVSMKYKGKVTFMCIVLNNFIYTLFRWNWPKKI